MKIINRAARLVTVTIEGKKYPLMPAGAAVEFPSDAVKKSDFLKALIKDRTLEVVTTGNDDLIDQADKETEKEAAKERKAALKEQAKELGIEITGNWGEDKIQAAIDEKLAE